MRVYEEGRYAFRSSLPQLCIDSVHSPSLLAHDEDLAPDELPPEINGGHSIKRRSRGFSLGGNVWVVGGKICALERLFLSYDLCDM